MLLQVAYSYSNDGATPHADTIHVSNNDSIAIWPNSDPDFQIFRRKKYYYMHQAHCNDDYQVVGVCERGVMAVVRSWSLWPTVGVLFH